MKKNEPFSGLLRIILLAGCFSMLFSGCVLFWPSTANWERFLGVTPEPKENAENVSNVDLRSPEKATLFFGSTDSVQVLKNSFFVQSNPETLAVVCSPGIEKSTFWFYPLPVSSAIHLVYFSYSEGRTTYIASYPMNSASGLSFFSLKPGLHYLGNNTHKVLVKGQGWTGVDQYGFVRSELGNEEQDLLRILKYYEGTDWEAIILARLEELKDVD